MLVPDVNVFLNVLNPGSREHRAASSWLEAVGNGGESVGVPSVVLSGVVRISTSRAFGDTRRTVEEAFAFCGSVLQMPAYVALIPGAGHWERFKRLVIDTQVSGNNVTDAYLAAFAIEHDATFVSFDRGFERFPGLKLLVP